MARTERLGLLTDTRCYESLLKLDLVTVVFCCCLWSADGYIYEPNTSVLRGYANCEPASAVSA